ncbi:hypothetical protein P389DRAFT_51164 [Cystobasidium minutum MCA 4210]|uniref:uncharacterized protein n=1 Tax=Cystobasidium minutum MCA 4210 TaxID=1397322 RepID=UPI0034CEAB79|eukprot:jgi/Rhomi1/51164/CE51163_927
MNDDSTLAIEAPLSSTRTSSPTSMSALDHAADDRDLVTSEAISATDLIGKKKQRLRGLQDLPPELLFKIKDLLVDLPDHASFGSLCHQTSSLYQDDEFRNLALRANVGRPNLFKDKSWASTARMVTKHLYECDLCHRYMHDATLNMDIESESAKKVYDKAGDAPWIAVISNLRQSAGRYSIDWTKGSLQERPELILASFGSSHQDGDLPATSTEEQYDPRLIEHPAMACRLAFIQPIRRVKCGFESDSVWQFGKAKPADKSQHGESSTITSASYHELNARAAQAQEYRSSCFNPDGITVLDLLLAASNTPEVPTDGLTDRPLVFGGILDDTLRGQNTIWVHATAAPESNATDGSIMNPLITPSPYSYASESTHEIQRHRHSASNTSIDWSRMNEANFGLCEPLLGNNYGFYPLEVN